jgi:uncharacterized protein (TIGR02246 family)
MSEEIGMNPEDEIQRAIVEMVDEFNRHDTEAVAARYTPDADFTNVWGRRLTGRAAIAAGLAQLFASRAKNAVLETRATTIRLIKPDVAIVHVENDMSGLVGLNGEHMPAHREHSMRVLVKEPDGWKVTVFHNTLVAP